MNLQDFRRVIFDSIPGDWNVMPVGDGPLYLDKFIEYGSGDEPHWLEHDTHYNRAAYLPDVSIGIAWGLGRRDEPLTFDTLHFPDPLIYATLTDLFWNGMLVDRAHGLVVDGGRAMLPYPEGLIASPDPLRPEIVAEQVTEDEVALWKLVTVLNGTSAPQFDSYLERSHFVVIPNPPPRRQSREW